MSTFHDLVLLGYERVRLKSWNRHAFVKLRMCRMDGENRILQIGHLYDPAAMVAMKCEEPVPVQVDDPTVVAGDDWEPYHGSAFEEFHKRTKNSC